MSELKQRIDSVARKAELLTSRYALLRRDKAAADETIAELSAQVASRDAAIDELRATVAELNSRLHYLYGIAVVEPQAQERFNVRKRLAQLLHDIDQCIADLSDCNE